MQTKRILVPLAIVAAVVIATQQYGLAGFLVVVGGVVMWLLLHFTRLMTVMRRAAHAPIGYCDSAVMLNAKLREGVNLLHVVAMTRALGEPLSAKDAQPEIFRWTDNTLSHVTCEFRDGRLAKWALFRPAEPGAPAP